MFEIAKNVNNIQTNGNNPILTYSQNPIKKEFEKQVVEPNQIPQTFCLKTEPTTFQPVRPFDFLLPDHVDVSESNQNVIRMTNRGILNKLNKFCSYDYDQATLSISSNCNSQDKKKFDSHPLHQNNNLIRQQKNASISKQDFLKNMMSSLIPTKRQILEKYQTAQNVSRSNSHENHHKNHHNFNGMKNYVSDFEDAKISGKNFPQNIVGFQKQNFQFNSDPQIINSNNFKANFHQMQMKTENINRNYQENYQNKNNNDKNISINNYSNQPHGTFASQNHTFIPPNISLSSQTHAIGSTHKSQTIDSKNLFYRTSQSDKYHKKQSQSPDGKSQTVYKQIFEEKNNHSKSVVERNDAPKPRNSNNFTNSTTPFSKKDSSPAFQQQQYINVPIIEKELQVQSNMMPLNIQQIYQHQYRPRPNSGYFYNNGSENNYMNNNVSSNNYCYPNNSNHYVGVNYPVQNMNPNLGYSKPNNYQTYGHVDMNGENQSAKFGLNYLPERNFGEKTRNSEYWKSPFYPYNNEN